MQKTREERAALMAKINHDLYLEGITKSDYQKELDQKVIDGLITPDESLELLLKHENIIHKSKLMNKINHDLYLDGLAKTDFENEMDQKFINGEVTLEERSQLILNHLIKNN